MALRGAIIGVLVLVLLSGCARPESRLDTDLELALFETFRDGRIERLEPVLATRADYPYHESDWPGSRPPDFLKPPPPAKWEWVVVRDMVERPWNRLPIKADKEKPVVENRRPAANP